MKLDLVIRDGMVADGLGTSLRRADVAVQGDRIVAVGDVRATGALELQADGAVVAPGFINVLSQAYESLQRDPRGLSDLYQGVTTEVCSERATRWARSRGGCCRPRESTTTDSE